MIRLFIDADACPVKDEIIKVGLRHELEMYFVSNQWMRLAQHPLIKIKVVSHGMDEADNWIADTITSDEICITSDIPLAHRCVQKGAFVLTPTGKRLGEDSIANALATRDLMTHLRDTGQIEGGGNAAFRKQDRSKFLSELETAIQKAKRA